MQANKDEEQFCKRLIELANIAEKRGICTYTDFLNLNEINLFYSIEKKLPGIKAAFWGGYEQAERQMLCFYDEESGMVPDYPLECIKIQPTQAKFAEELTHRDYLGALMNLGIERSRLGDILIDGKVCYMFCEAKMSSYIAEALTVIRHTNVICSVVLDTEFHYEPKYEPVSGSVASLRLDSVIALAFKSSRSSLIGLIAGGKVYVNGKVVLSNSYNLKEDDIISVRGLGKFVYKGENHATKKGRLYVTILKYA